MIFSSDLVQKSLDFSFATQYLWIEFYNNWWNICALVQWQICLFSNVYVLKKGSHYPSDSYVLQFNDGCISLTHSIPESRYWSTGTLYNQHLSIFAYVRLKKIALIIPVNRMCVKKHLNRLSLGSYICVMNNQFSVPIDRCTRYRSAIIGK